MMIVKNESESSIQIALVTYFKTKYPAYHKQILKIPNEGKRTPRNGARMVQEGLQKGAPDLLILVQRTAKNRHFVGLALEVKKKGKKLTDDQVAYLKMLDLNGWATGATDDLDHGIKLLDRYMNLCFK